MSGMPMPIESAASSISASFTTLTQATARTPLANTKATSAKAATADRPLLEVHLAASPGQKADRRANSDDGGDRRQANGSSAHGRRPAFRAVSTRYAPHMHRLLNTIQAMSQNRLNGRPRIIGSIRSQSGTEKHIAANGISASESAPVEGLPMCLPGPPL